MLDGEEWSDTTEGTPQGAGIGPLLANVVLHNVLDLWVHQWRQRQARGKVIIVRYADDFVMGFQYEADAWRMVGDLHERLATFGLTLHEAKTRLIEFGKLSAKQRLTRGARRPDTFAFLGFTHYCARSRDGRFVVKRRTDCRRLTRKLHAVRAEQRRRMHAPLTVQYRWLCSVLRGALPLLRSAEQLACAGRVLRRTLPWVVSGASTPEPTAAHVGPVPPGA